MKITFNGNADELEKAVLESLDQVTEWLLSDVVKRQVIPFDIGTMQNTATFVNRENLSEGETSIVVSTPYARRLYFHPEYNFQKVNNPNAKGRWFDDYLEGGIYYERLARNYAKILKMKGGL